MFKDLQLILDRFWLLACQHNHVYVINFECKDQRFAIKKNIGISIFHNSTVELGLNRKISWQWLSKIFIHHENTKNIFTWNSPILSTITLKQNKVLKKNQINL